MVDYVKKYKKYKQKYIKLRDSLLEMPPVGEPSVNVERVFGETDIRPLESEHSSNDVEVSILRMNLNEFRDEDFTTNIGRDIESILMIDSIELFDNFTDLYTDVRNGRLEIDWETLAEDFRGLYVVNKPDLRRERFDKAPKDGKEYESWWVTQMDTDQVVIFDRTEETETDEDTVEKRQQPLPLDLPEPVDIETESVVQDPMVV